MRSLPLLSVLVVLATVSGCGAGKAPNSATGAFNAGVNESAYPATIGPDPKGADSKAALPQSTETPEAHIARLERSKIPPPIRKRMIERIRRENGLDRTTSESSPAPRKGR